MKRRSLAGPVVKSLIFILVTALATTVLAVSIAGTGVGDTAGYNARFTDTTGLTSGDSVRIAGVKVGQVDSIKVVDRRIAQVHFSVQKGRTLPASVTATIKYLNMVGQRYIDLAQGAGPVGAALRPGATIPLEPHHPGPGPHPALQRLPAALRGPVPEGRQPALRRDRAGAPGRGRHRRRPDRQHRLAHHHAGRQGPGDRPGHRQPQLGAEDGQHPRDGLQRPGRHPPAAGHRLLRRPAADRPVHHRDLPTHHQHRGTAPGRPAAAEELDRAARPALHQPRRQQGRSCSPS